MSLQKATIKHPANNYNFIMTFGKKFKMTIFFNRFLETC